MSHDSTFRTAYEARGKLPLDEQAKISTCSWRRLWERGIQLNRGMLKNGMSLEDIAKFTGFSIEEIWGILLKKLCEEIAKFFYMILLHCFLDKFMHRQL